MLISVPKCAVLCSKDPHEYILNGEPIPVASSMRDLGITITPDLDFNLHITQTIQSATLVCNTIFRCFIIKNPDFYLNLYETLVLPKRTYCSEVWRPYLKKRIDAIERVKSKFERRVSLRCNVDRS